MKTPIGAIAGMNWKTMLALGAVVIAVLWFLVWRVKKAPGDIVEGASDAVSKIGTAAGAALDSVEKTVQDPNNRANRWTTAILSPVLGTSDFDGSPNTIGGAIEEATRSMRGWF